MRAIYKYLLFDAYSVLGIPKSVTMPVDSKILTVASQSNNIFLWAEVNTESDAKERLFEIYSTGREIPIVEHLNRAYLGTVFLFNDAEVYHVYERFN